MITFFFFFLIIAVLFPTGKHLDPANVYRQLNIVFTGSVPTPEIICSKQLSRYTVTQNSDLKPSWGIIFNISLNIANYLWINRIKQNSIIRHKK